MEQKLRATVLDLPTLTKVTFREALGGRTAISPTSQRRMLRHRVVQVTCPGSHGYRLAVGIQDVLNLALVPKLSPTTLYYLKTQKV